MMGFFQNTSAILISHLGSQHNNIVSDAYYVYLQEKNPLTTPVSPSGSHQQVDYLEYLREISQKNDVSRAWNRWQKSDR